MGKVIQYAADAALIAGAIAMTVVTGGGGLFAMGGLITMTAGQVSSTAMAMGMMGGGMLFSSIARAMEGGGASTAMSVKNSAGNRQTICGQTRANGTVIFLSNGNGVINGNVIYQVIAWASHPCQEVSFLYTDGREIYFYGQGHNAVAGAQGYDDGANHIDPAGNTYNFGGGSGNYHLACWSTLGPYAGFWISQLGEGCPPPGGDYNFTGESKWTASATLNGICATAVAASSNPNMFSQIPQIKAAVKGKNDIYDPRLDPQFAGGATPTLSSSYTPNSAYCAWTDNAALIIADFLVNKDYGLRYTWDEIDIQQLIAAANICDQPVTLATGKLGSWAAGSYFTIGQTIVDSNGRQQTVIGYFNTGVDAQAKTGGSTPNWKTVQGEITYDNQIMWTAGVLGSALTEKQYTINGIIDWAAAPGDSLQQLLEACAGRIGKWNGQIKIFPGAWYGSSGITYGLGDIVGKINFKQKKFRDYCNAVRAKYICPSYPYNVVGYDKNHRDTNIFDGQYQPTDAPEYAQDALHGYASDANLAADGGVKVYQDRSYQFVQSCAQTQRLMKIYLLRSRKLWSGTIRVNAKALQNAPNDVVGLTLPQFGWSNKLFEIVELRHIVQIEDNQPPQLLWELDLQEASPDIYSWDSSEERTMTNSDSPTLLTPMTVSPVTNLLLESDNTTAVTALDGTVTPRILATWTPPADSFVTSGGYLYVYYQKNGDTAWTALPPLPGNTTSVFIGNVVAGQAYNVQVIAAHAGGATSSAVDVGPITVGTAYSNFVSTVLNNQGSTLQVQPLTIPYTVTNNSCVFSWAAQSMLRPDGSTLSIPAGSVSYTGLSASTTYYSYWYASSATGVLGQTNGTPPPTTPSAVMAAQMALDGRYPVGVISFTTLAASNSGTGGGTGGGGNTCPEASELVEVQGKGQIPASQVQAGDLLKGFDFTAKQDVYRKVVQVGVVSCPAWRVVDGHQVSPCESIYHEEQWKPAFRASGATMATSTSQKVLITVDALADGDHNYWLVSGTPLLIHNMISVC